MSVQIRTHQLADAAVTSAKIAELDAVIGYTAAHSLSNETDIVHKKYVDDIAAYGVTWKEPVKVFNMVDDTDGGGSPPTPGGSGEAYVVDNWGVGYNDGDIIEWQGTAWQVIVSNSGGEPPNGTRVLVSAFPAGSFASYANDFAVYNASTNAWVFITDVKDGDAVLINGDGGWYENRAYVYDDTTKWIQFAGVGIYTAGDGIDITGSEISAEPNTAYGIQVTVGGIGIKLATGTYGYPGLKFNDHALETGPLMVLAGDGIVVANTGVTVDTLEGSGIGVNAAGVYNRSKQPVSAMRVYDAVATAPGTPVTGVTYLATANGTWGGVAVNAGDFVIWTGTTWSVLVPGSGGYAAYGTRFVVHPNAADEFAPYQKQIMTVTTSNTNDPSYWIAVVPSSGDGVIISSSYGTGIEYVYAGATWTASPLLQTDGGLEIAEVSGAYAGLKVLVKNEGGLEIDSNGVYVKYADGLTIDGTSLEVKPGNYIKVNAAGVNVDETFPWHPPVHIVLLTTDADQGGSVPSNPLNGYCYIVDNWGGSYTDGDVYQYRSIGGGTWTKLYSTAGAGKPPTGLRAMIAPTALGTFSGHAKEIGWYDGTNWSFQQPDDGDQITVSASFGALTLVNVFWGNGAQYTYKADTEVWSVNITKFEEVSVTSWPAATVTWDLDVVPAQIGYDSLFSGSLAIYYNGQRLLRTASTGGGQGTYYMNDAADTVKFDFTPTTGSTLEAVIGRF